jgi:hypothetical protein
MRNDEPNNGGPDHSGPDSGNPDNGGPDNGNPHALRDGRGDRGLHDHRNRTAQRRAPNRVLALVLALFTAWPILCIGLFFVYIVAAMFSIGMGRAGHGLPWAGVVMPIVFLTLLEGFVLLVVYFMHLLLFNPQLPTEKKIAWGVAMLIGSVFAMAAYWYLFLWREGGEGRGGPRRLQAL